MESLCIRALDRASIAAFAVVVGWQMSRLWAPSTQHPWLMLAAFAAGYFFADLVSGVVHWLADSWGSTRLPVIGEALLRPFREHHLDQKAITRHSFAETNGNNCLICVPAGFAALFVPLDSPGWFFLMSALLWSMLWVMGTNQFHKWSHLDHPPKAVAWLQRWHLILPPSHHALHHAAPHDSHYCITSGWLNRPLEALQLFRRLERVVTSASGALPRSEDLTSKG